MNKDIKIAIEKTLDYGFTVYVNEDRNYFHFSDGKNIGYVQKGQGDVYALSILYVPCRINGSSAQFRDAPYISKKLLEDCLDRNNYFWVNKGGKKPIKWFDNVSIWFDKIWDKDVKEVTYA